MKKNMVRLIIAALLISPMLSSCNTKKLEEEIVSLKQQVESLNSEKSAAEAQINALTVRVEEEVKANEDLKAELAKAQAAAQAAKAKVPAAKAKAPTAKKGHKK